MSNYSYEEVTAMVARTIRALTQRSSEESDDLDLSFWDMARGAAHLWESLAGNAATVSDRAMLHKLLADMPGYHEADLASDGMLYDYRVPAYWSVEASNYHRRGSDNATEAFPHYRRTAGADAR